MCYMIQSCHKKEMHVPLLLKKIVPVLEYKTNILFIFYNFNDSLLVFRLRYYYCICMSINVKQTVHEKWESDVSVNSPANYFGEKGSDRIPEVIGLSCVVT